MPYGKQTNDILATVRRLLKEVTTTSDNEESRILHDVIPKIQQAIDASDAELKIALQMLAKRGEFALTEHDGVVCAATSKTDIRRHVLFVQKGSKQASTFSEDDEEVDQTAKINELELSIQRLTTMLERSENRRIASESRREEEVNALQSAKSAAEARVTELRQELELAQAAVVGLRRQLEQERRLSPADMIRLNDLLDETAS